MDLRRDVDTATADELRAALRTHTVLVVRGQHLTADQHVATVSVFGQPFDHPTAPAAGRARTAR